MAPQSFRFWPALLVSVALLGGCKGKSDADILTEARAALSKQDQAAAIIQMKSLLQRVPDSGEARFLLGWALLEKGEYGPALLELNKARDSGFDDEQATPKLARALLANGKFKEILKSFGDVTLKDPGLSAELNTAVAVAHLRLGQHDAAEASIQKALKASPGYGWALLTRARMTAGAGKFDEALAIIESSMTPSGPNGEAQYLKATLLQWGKQDLEGAIKAYNAAADDPRHAQNARVSLAHIHLNRGDTAAVKAQFEAMKKLHPNHAQTRVVEALAAFSANDFARTEALVDQLLRVSPDNPSLLTLGGAASLNRGAFVAAEAKLGKVVNLVERAMSARQMLAETYLKMGQPAKALAVLRPLLESAKPSGDALALAGQAQLQAGDPRQAEALFTAAAKVKPDSPAIMTALALTDLAKGNLDAGFAALTRIAAKDPGDTADLALISAHMRRGQVDQALAAIAALEKKRPGRPGPAHLRGQALQIKGDGPGARQAFEAALAVDKSYFASTAALAAMDVRDGKADSARTRLADVVKADPRNLAARMALIDVLRATEAKPDEVLAAVDEAIRNHPGDAAPRIAKIRALSAAGDVKGAAGVAQAALAANSQDPLLLDASGTALALAGDEQQAISAFNKAASLQVGSPVPHLRLAELYSRRGDQTAIRSSLARAFEVAPGSPDVHRALLTHAARTRDPKTALAAAKDVQKRFPQSASGFVLEGDLEAVRKNAPAALVAYRLGAEKSDGGSIAAVRIYDAHEASGASAAAEQFATDWLKRHPKDAHFMERLGTGALRKKNYPLAESHFSAAVALQPNSAATLNNLAWLMAERGAPGAVAMAERALAVAPGMAPLLDTLAKALASEGQVPRAIEVQRQAIAKAPERPVYRLSLAKLYVKSGNKDGARSELTALAAMGAAFPGQAEVAALQKELAK